MKKISKTLPSRIYLDYAASTPVDPRVFRAMRPYFSECFGNPGSLHGFGQEAMAAVDEARETIADTIGADFGEIFFTGSATEANNLALFGVFSRALRAMPGRKPHLIVSAIEHESVLLPARQWENQGGAVTILPVTKEGFVELGEFERALRPETVLVSVIHASNELGTVQPLDEIAAIVERFRAERKIAPYPLLHTDAAQGFAFTDFRTVPFRKNLHLMTLSAQKVYGPKGVGALFVAEAARPFLESAVWGGGQEFGLRPGTENVPALAGFGAATRIALGERAAEAARLRKLKESFFEGVKKVCPRAEINGNKNRATHVVERKEAPHILNLWFPGRPSADLLVALDLQGIAVSAGSACSSRSAEPSYVVRALGSENRARESLRFSFGRGTGKDEITATLRVLKQIFS